MEDERNSLLEQIEEEAEARGNMERQASSLTTQASHSHLQRTPSKIELSISVHDN